MPAFPGVSWLTRGVIFGSLYIMARKWEEFDEAGAARISPLHVSLSPKGQVFLSGRAYEALEKPTHVVMLWEEETSTIGIRAAPERATNAFQLYPTHLSGSYRF